MAILNTASLSSKITKGVDEKVEVINKSNTHVASNMDNDITIVKTTEKDWAIPNKQITITTVITNNTSENIEDITILDTLSEGATFVKGSLKVGSQTYEDLDPTQGFTLPVTLGGFGANMTFTYDVLIDEYVAANQITNKTKITITLDEKQYDIESNELLITILNNEISLLKTANTKAVKSGDVITYTITITNSGTILNTDMFFTDPIPEGTTFVENSVKVNDALKEGVNPSTGFQLDDLDANQSIKIEFQVTVN